MTQAAKAQEPSMEEILASIRRIIADDDASKTPQRAPEPPKAAPRPAAPPPPAPVEPEVEEPEPVAARVDVANEAADILDLTESMAAPSFSEPDPEPEPSPAPQFRKIEGISDVSFDESEQKPAAARDRAAATASYCRARPARRSIPPSTRLPIRCWCRTRARSRIWCAKCCGRCSRPGSTTICPAWWSGWFGPRSSGSRAGARASSHFRLRISRALERSGKLVARDQQARPLLP